MIDHAGRNQESSVAVGSELPTGVGFESVRHTRVEVIAVYSNRALTPVLEELLGLAKTA
jgi:hypothetical protein